MKINDIDISSFKAKQLSVDIQPSEKDVEAEWFTQSLSPLILKENRGFKKVDVEIYFKGESKSNVSMMISNFISKFSKLNKLNLDGYPTIFYGILRDKSISKINSFASILTINLDAIECGTEIVESFNNIATKVINVKGNDITPAIVEITPTAEMIDFIIEGLSDEPIKLKDLVGSKTFILDGEKEKATVDGVNSFKQTDMWEFPRLKPGSTTIKVSRTNCTVKIKYKPRYN